MSKFRLIPKENRSIKLSSDQVIQAIANYLADEDMLTEAESSGVMTYMMDDDAGMTVELIFDHKQTMQQENKMRLVEIIDEEYQGGLRKWFKQKWVNIGKKKKGGGHPECGTLQARKVDTQNVCRLLRPHR